MICYLVNRNLQGIAGIKSGIEESSSCTIPNDVDEIELIVASPSVHAVVCMHGHWGCMILCGKSAFLYHKIIFYLAITKVKEAV